MQLAVTTSSRSYRVRLHFLLRKNLAVVSLLKGPRISILRLDKGPLSSYYEASGWAPEALLEGLSARLRGEGMKADQISIFLENKSGRLAEVTDLLARSNINIRALSLADTADFGIFRLIVNDPVRATGVLKEAGFTIGRNEVVAVVVPDLPGGLAGILGTLQGKGINVEYMYAFTARKGDGGILLFRFSDTAAAIHLLKARKMDLLDSAELERLIEG